jgi:hypothetical protein
MISSCRMVRYQARAGPLAFSVHTDESIVSLNVER